MSNALSAMRMGLGMASRAGSAALADAAAAVVFASLMVDSPIRRAGSSRPRGLVALYVNVVHIGRTTAPAQGMRKRGANRHVAHKLARGRNVAGRRGGATMGVAQREVQDQCKISARCGGGAT